MESKRKKLTPTHRRLLSVLRDGKHHDSDELRRCLKQGGSPNLLRVHMCTLRVRIQPMGKTVVCEIIKNRAWYRLIEFPK